MKKTVDAADIQDKLSQMLEEVSSRGDQYIIERDGKAVAALVPVEIYEIWLQTRERFFRLVDEIRAENVGVDPEQVERDIEAAVQEVRARR